MTLVPLHELVVGSTRPLLLVFMAAVLLVLLIACANVANLLLARATARTQEISLSAALGASRGRIVRSLLAEGVVLSGGGAVIGLALAWGGTRAFKALAPAAIPRVDQVAVNGRMLMCALLVAAASAMLCTLAPAWRATRLRLGEDLHEGGRTTGRRGRVGAGLVVAELALAATLLSGAGLLVRNFRAMGSWSPGFEEEHLTTVQLFASHDRYPDPAAVSALWQRVEEAMRSVPGVLDVGETSAGPIFGGGDGSDEIRRAGEGGASHLVTGAWFDVSPGYFRAMGIPLLRGRAITEQDAASGPAVAIVNETLARKLWPEGVPPSARVTLPHLRRSVDVVGVVRDVPPIRPGAAAEPQIFWSNRQYPRWGTYFVVRSQVPPARIARVLRSRVSGIDPELSPSNMSTMTELVARKLVRPRFNMMVLGVFAATALLLAAIGTYGLLAYLVSRRTREFGVRVALGCQPRRLVAGVLREGFALALAGMAVGAVGAVALGRALAHAIEGTAAFDATTFVTSLVVLSAVVLVACALPALRAGRVDPVAALRAE